ncbi:aminotransferase class III-fold pyridoxal phosphate-dependent enzyme [Microbacterium sp. 1P10AE]|uniref:aminotransferase class III-fold pyridoxal phosphate-dependent enzyme n=1 Tax=Microbacterium sp. 1P10AE TaxID=3132286 RepID=UPI0039A22FD2
MTETLFDYFSHGELPTPTLPTAEAVELLREVHGLEVELQGLGSQQDQNFLVRPVDGGEPLGVLKISNPVFSEIEIEMQDAAAAAVARAEPGLRIPEVVDGPRGPVAGWWQTSQGRLHARIISFVSGATLTGSGYLAPRVIERLGELAAAVSVALAEETHPASGRVLQWDLRHAERVIAEIAATEPDAEVREYCAAATAAALAVLSPVADGLPRQLGHFDVTDDNVLRPHGVGTLPDAVIDFGDVIDSWAVGEIAVTVSSVLHHDRATSVSTLPAIAAFDRRRPLSDDEITALWPLVVLRGVVLVLSGRQQVRLDDANDYASGALDREFEILRRSVAVPLEVATARIRHALGRPSAPAPAWEGASILPETIRPVVLDATTLSPLADEGAWLDDDALERAARRLLDGGADAVVLPALVPTLLGAPSRTPEEPATVPTAASVWFAAPATLTLPDAALSVRVGDGILHSPARTVDVPARTRVRVLLTRLDPADVPDAVRPSDLPGWRAVIGDATAALGVAAPAAGPDDLLERREAVVAEVQEHYYSRPPRIERGWREYLVDVDGRVYLDMVNNVASVGHAHPRIHAAVSRQTRLLNTNSRFHYAAITEYGERLAATLPDELDTVFFVNSGSEAVDLAIRLGLAATGRTDVVAMAEAYHGWTYASDAVSTSIADNPNALETRPDWVHTVDAANSYRGRHRGADAARYAPEAVARLRALAAEGHAPAAFLSETFYGNAGGVALPDGYLREVYATVRELGGLAIADEVQVGFGRLGWWFWGFQQQGVVPDIVAVAKSIGGGFPLGAVITRREIADRYRTQGYFFSSTGGSPLSSVVGLTVLDIIRNEGLQENARVVGGHLKARLEALGERHPLVGTVHGSGLYLGLEFVRDRETLEPATEETAAICDRLLELGVVMQPTGDHQNVLKIKPPLCVSRDSVDYFADMLDRVLTTGF